jgi:hypothetical protein
MLYKYLEVVEARIESPIGDFIAYSVTEVFNSTFPQGKAVYGLSPQEFLASQKVDFYIYDQSCDVHYGSREIQSENSNGLQNSNLKISDPFKISEGV